MVNITDPEKAQSFTATLSTPQSNITGDGTLVTLVWDIVPAGFDYNTTTGITTAKMKCIATFTPNVRLTGLTASHTLGVGGSVATGQSFEWCRYKIGRYRSLSDNKVTISPTIPIILNVGDQVYFTLQISGGTKAVSLDSTSTLNVTMVPL